VDHRPTSGAYRGRRRVPTPPRSRYAAVVTSAFVGAGVVALGSSALVPDLDGASVYAANATTIDAAGELPFGDAADRAAATAGDRASRTGNSSQTAPVVGSANQSAPVVWLLPLKQYTVSSNFGARWGTRHPGVDLAAPEGTPMYAVGAGKVILSRHNGGYGYNVMIDHGNGVVSAYGHCSRLFAKEGQTVQAGDRIALVGNTGYSTGPHLHLEIRVNGEQVDPVPWLKKNGVDVNRHIEVASGGVITS
jgi:murein DD-endopeptidase MepM/ murein hydrolase activator NlpD